VRVKEAVAQLNKTRPLCGMREIDILYMRELADRMKLRGHNQPFVSKLMAEALVKEMNEWIYKVCAGLGWPDDLCAKARQECNQTAITSVWLATRRR